MLQLSRRMIVAAILPGVALTAGAVVWAAEIASPVPGKRVVLRGYDPVAYFTEARPVQGSSEFWFAFDDAVYFFQNTDNRALFMADPDRYAPQYDGYCTMKLSRGEKVEADPQAWTIADGKLYVFGSPRGVSNFHQDPATIATKAAATWRSLRAGD